MQQFLPRHSDTSGTFLQIPANRFESEPMDIQDKSQSSKEEGKEDGDDDIIGRMEIDDASDMTEVAGILLHLNVSKCSLSNAEIWQGWIVLLEIVNFLVHMGRLASEALQKAHGELDYLLSRISTAYVLQIL